MTKTTVLLKLGFVNWVFSLEFCYKDLWFGVYWENEFKESIHGELDVYLGIPFIVFHIHKRRFYSIDEANKQFSIIENNVINLKGLRD